MGSKTANGILRYCPDEAVAIIDSTQAGKSASDILDYASDVPIVASLDKALALSPAPDALLVGIAPTGGDIPAGWRPLPCAPARHASIS